MSNNLFVQLYNALNSQLGLNNLQLIATPQNFNFPVTETGQISPQVYQIVSRMAEYAPVGSYAPGDVTFFDAYRQVLSHVTFTVSPDKQRDLQSLQDQVTKANDDLVKAVSAMNQAYLAAKQKNGALVFGDWISGPGATSKKSVDDARKKFELRQDLMLEKELDFMPDSLRKASKLLKKPDSEPASSTAPRGWTKVPNGTGILEWQPDFTIGTTGEDFRTQLAGGSAGAFTVDLSSSQKETITRNSFATASASDWGFFWSAPASGGWEKMDAIENDSSTSVQISVQSSTRVLVTPGPWYDSGFMSALVKMGRNDVYVISSPWTATGNQNALFGEKGLLSTRVAELLVVYKPRFTIKMSASTLKSSKQKIEASASLRIGPFSLGGSGSRQQSYQCTFTSDDSMTIESKSNDPLIIGATVAFPGIG